MQSLFFQGTPEIPKDSEQYGMPVMPGWMEWLHRRYAELLMEVGAGNCRRGGARV